MSEIIVVGAGIFGVTAALALRHRDYRVSLVDPGPLPHPLAASTDISKVIRLEYGTDEQYMSMGEAAIDGWQNWNQQWSVPLFHQTGVIMLARKPISAGGYEFESYQMLLKRGHRPEQLDGDEITRRFPAWKPGKYVDGFFHALGGFVESGRVVQSLLLEAREHGVHLIEKEVCRLIVKGNRISGVQFSEGSHLSADHVLVTAGSWSHLLVPGLDQYMKATGHPVFHLRPENPQLFRPPHFVVFTADVTNTGWYGFPVHPTEGVVKIANHGVGVTLHPQDDERIVTATDEAELRNFLLDSLPSLAHAPIVFTRRCLYADTLDEHFWIDQHPEIKGLSVATGGSGHGFKFAPILGDLIADAVEGHPNPWLNRFRWRELGGETLGEEAARFHG